MRLLSTTPAPPLTHPCRLCMSSPELSGKMMFPLRHWKLAPVQCDMPAYTGSSQLILDSAHTKLAT